MLLGGGGFSRMQAETIWALPCELYHPVYLHLSQLLAISPAQGTIRSEGDNSVCEGVGQRVENRSSRYKCYFLVLETFSEKFSERV